MNYEYNQSLKQLNQTIMDTSLTSRILEGFVRTNKMRTCEICGKNGPQSKYWGRRHSQRGYTDYQLPLDEESICDVGIFVGPNAYGIRVGCCADCIRIGRQWTHIGVGFDEMLDFHENVRKLMPYKAKVKFLRPLPQGQAHNEGNKITITRRRVTERLGRQFHERVEEVVKREMPDGKEIIVPVPNGVGYAKRKNLKEDEIEAKYEKPCWVWEEFEACSHKPLVEGMVLNNTNPRFLWDGKKTRNCDNVQLIKKLDETQEGQDVWVAVDYAAAVTRATLTLQRWWKNRCDAYYGPKKEGHVVERDNEWPVLRAFQGTEKCRLCGGYATDARIQQEGIRCRVCTRWEIDDKYCLVCGEDKASGGNTDGCPGCFKRT